MNRRDFIRTAGGAAGGVAAVSASTGTAAASEEGGGGGGGTQPDFGGYLDNVSNFSGVEDATGQDEVTVEVGVDNGGQPYGFGPAAVHIDTGTTVIWEWTGEGGGHNVVAEDDTFNSGSPVPAEGTTYEYTFEEGGIYNYFCSPHKSLDMKGSVVVGTAGEDYETVQVGGGDSGPNTDPEHMGIPFQAHFVGIATMLMMVVSLVFTFFLLKYGESPHVKGGND